MSKRTRGAILLVGAILVALILWGVAQRQIRLERSISETIKQYNVGYTPHIGIAAVTDFAWDTLYIFAPYTPEDEIERQLGGWFGVRWISISTNDSVTLLVFSFNARVVRWIELPRATGDFSLVAGKQPFTPETALFFIFPEGSNQLRVLRAP